MTLIGIRSSAGAVTNEAKTKMVKTIRSEGNMRFVSFSYASARRPDLCETKLPMRRQR
jgi:hypothetical protein